LSFIDSTAKEVEEGFKQFKEEFSEALEEVQEKDLADT